MPTKTASSGAIELRRLERVSLDVWIVGTAPIIMHKWSEKAKASMPGAPGSDAGPKPKKGVREPEEEAASCVYKFNEDGPIASGNIGFPATGFKAAIIGACRLFDKPSMTEAKQLIYVEGEEVGTDQLVRIFFKGEPTLRIDTPRLANGSTDLRYRYQFSNWWAKLTVHFIPSSISSASIAALVDAAGFGGVGEWRPSAPKSFTGTFGTFRALTEKEYKDFGIKG